jgi:hypothetical protein
MFISGRWAVAILTIAAIALVLVAILSKYEP